jgi:hypothetical protein
MVLATKEPGNAQRPEKRKVIVLVRTRTVTRPKSLFDRHGPKVDVTEWIYVRLNDAAGADTHPLLAKGSWSTTRERPLRRRWKFVGFLGELRGNIDWETV